MIPSDPRSGLTHRALNFWDALAPHHEAIENSYLDLRSVRRILPHIRAPALVVGAGQGLIVDELRRLGRRCDGIDLSAEMLRHARMRRGLGLVQADARALPFATGAYTTLLYATGVVDFMSDEQQIRKILQEGRRIAGEAGIIWVAFYRVSAATETLLIRLGLLEKQRLRHRETLELYRLSPVPALAWVARRAKIGYARAAMLMFRSCACSTWQEKRNAVRLQRIFRKPKQAEGLIRAAPEGVAYRNETEIRELFNQVSIRMKRFEALGSCYIVQV